MSKNLDLKVFKELYTAYKQYSVPVLMMLASALLIFFALIPQFQDLLATLGRRGQEQEKLQVLKNNLNLLSATNEKDLDAKLSTALKALPVDKDFESVLTNISSVVNRSGVSLGSFEFRVGDLESKALGNDLLPSLALTLALNDGVSGVSRFMTNLAESLPVSEVKKVDVNINFATISVAFYYKSLASVSIQPDLKIIPLSVKQTELLSKLSSWNEMNNFAPESTSSAFSTTPF